MSSSGAGAASPPPGGIFGPSGIGGFGYGVGVSVGVLLIISTIALAIYFCTRTSLPASSAAVVAQPGEQPGAGDVELGIDEATLETYPVVPYAEARRQKAEEGGGGGAVACSVCLECYRDSDVLRVLPECGHLFHRECVDPWLRQHPTCPLCRTSPLPSPMPTPLAEVTPLALARTS